MKKKSDLKEGIKSANREEFIDHSVKFHKRVVLGLEILFPEDPYPQ